MFLDPLRGFRSHHNLASLCEARDAGRQVGRRSRGGEGPAPATRCVELGRSHHRGTAVDPHVDRHRRIDPSKLEIKARHFREQLESRAGGIERVAR